MEWMKPHHNDRKRIDSFAFLYSLSMCLRGARGKKNNFPQEVWGGVEESDVGQRDAEVPTFSLFLQKAFKACIPLNN